MTEAFAYCEITEDKWPIVGKPVRDTRIHRAEGPPEHTAAWYETVCDLLGECVSPGGACMIVPVTRAAIHHRIKQGKLTCLLYEVKESITVLGFKIAFRDAPYSYVPVSELKEWRKDIEHRLLRDGTISKEELEGAKPDWSGDFSTEKSKKAGKKEKTK